MLPFEMIAVVCRYIIIKIKKRAITRINKSFRCHVTTTHTDNSSWEFSNYSVSENRLTLLLYTMALKWQDSFLVFITFITQMTHWADCDIYKSIYFWLLLLFCLHFHLLTTTFQPQLTPFAALPRSSVMLIFAVWPHSIDIVICLHYLL